MNSNKIIKMLAFILIALCLSSCFLFPVYSVNNSMSEINIEEKKPDENKVGFAQNDPDEKLIHSERAISTEDEYEIDKVVVVLKHKYSKVNNKRTTSDFNAELFSDVEDLSYVKGYNSEKRLNTHRVNEDEFHQILLLSLKKPGKENVMKAIDFLYSLDSVLSAEPNYLYKAQMDYKPNDTYFDEQWGFKKISIEDAWDISKGTTSVKVGFLEDGISSHDDIDMANVIQGNIQYDPDATYSHGTHVIGVVGAITNNAKGVAGIAQVGLVCLKHQYSTDFTNSLRYAADNDISIVNASLHYTIDGKPAKYNISNAAAIQNYPGLVVCAAGNDGVNIDETPYFPASYEFDNVITVASTTSTDTKRSDSNYGVASVDLGAPGNSIYCPDPGNDYKMSGGTSIAAPFVTGVAALLKSEYPDMSAETIKYYIENGVDKIDALEDKVATGGRLNAYKALSGVKTFKVRYDSNGGIGTMADTTVIYNNITHLSANKFTYSGAEFGGWCAYRQSDQKWLYTNGTSNAWYKEGSQKAGYYKYVYRDLQTLAKTTSVNNDVIVMQAQWDYDVTVNFNANTGSGTMASITADFTTTTNLPSNAFTKSGYRFDHWYVKNKNGETLCYSGPEYAWYDLSELPYGYYREKLRNGVSVDKNTIPGLVNGDSITLYAYWEPENTILGDVDKNGFVGTNDVTLVQNYLANTSTLTAEQKLIADVNYSNSVTIKDATLIQKYVRGEIKYFVD